MPVIPFSGRSATEMVNKTRKTAISNLLNALQRVKWQDGTEIEGVPNTGHLDEFVYKITVCGRLLHFETRQDHVLT